MSMYAPIIAGGLASIVGIIVLLWMNHNRPRKGF